MDSSVRDYQHFVNHGGPTTQFENSTTDLSTTYLDRKLKKLKYNNIRTSFLYGLFLAIVAVLIIAIVAFAVVSLNDANKRIKHMLEVTDRVSVFMRDTEPILGPLAQRNATLDTIIREVLFSTRKQLGSVINGLISAGEITLNGADFRFDIGRLLGKFCNADCNRFNRTQDAYIKGVPLRATLTIEDIGLSPALILQFRCSATIGAFVDWPLKNNIGLSILKTGNHAVAHVIVTPMDFINCENPGSPGQKTFEWQVIKSTVNHAIKNDIVRYRVELLHLTSG